MIVALYLGTSATPEAGAYVGEAKNMRKTVRVNSYTAAKELYKTACGRLLDVNCWPALSSLENDELRLYNDRGLFKLGFAAKGDYVQSKINTSVSDILPNPGWLAIEKIINLRSDDQARFGMLLRPGIAPVNLRANLPQPLLQQNTITFSVTRNHQMVTASIHMHGEPSLADSKKDTFYLQRTVESFRQMLGLQSPWNRLLEGLIAE